MTSIFSQVQPVASGQSALNIIYQANSSAVIVTNAFTRGGTIPANGTNDALSVNNFSTGSGASINSWTPSVGNKAPLKIQDNAGVGHVAIRVNDSSGTAGFLVFSDGTFQAAQRPSAVMTRASVSDFVAGISDTLRLINNGAKSTNSPGDGTQLVFGIGLNRQAGMIQGIVDAVGPNVLGSLRFYAQSGTAAVERLRVSAAGIGVFGSVANPVAQQSAAAVTSGYTSGSGTGVTIDGRFKGASGSTAYTIGDIVTALKAYGWLAQ
jgi:hypothetical protein